MAGSWKQRKAGMTGRLATRAAACSMAAWSMIVLTTLVLPPSATARPPAPPEATSTPVEGIKRLMEAFQLGHAHQPEPYYLVDGTQPAGARQAPADQHAVASSPFWLGIALAKVEGALKAQMNREHPGVLIMRVAPDSAAAVAGLQEFDVIVQVNDQHLSDPTDLTKAVAQSEGQELTLLVVRAGKEQQLKITPRKRPEAAAVRRQPDPAAVAANRLWLWQTTPDGRRVGMRFYPGMVLPKAELPADMTIELQKTGSEPARIKVTQKDQTWTASEDKLVELPPHVRGHVEMLLGRPQGLTLAPATETDNAAPHGLRILTGEGNFNALPLPDPSPAPPPVDSSQLQRQLERMSQQLEALQKKVDALGEQ